MSTRTLRRLRRNLKALGITQERVAMRAGVTRTHVCHVLAGDFTSRPVLNAAASLIAEAEEERRAGAPVPA